MVLLKSVSCGKGVAEGTASCPSWGPSGPSCKPRKWTQRDWYHYYSFWVFLGLFVLSVFDVGSVDAADLILAKDGKAKAVIVLSEAPSSAARKAAKVLSDHLFQISGARLEVVKESAIPKNARFIAIGESSLTRKLEVTAKGLGPGGILIRSFHNALVIHLILFK